MSLQLRWVTFVAATAMVGGLSVCGTAMASVPAPDPTSQGRSQSSSQSTSSESSSTQSRSSRKHQGHGSRAVPQTKKSRTTLKECSNGSCTVTVSGVPTQNLTLPGSADEAELVVSDFADDSVSLGMGTERKQVTEGGTVDIGGWTITLESAGRGDHAAKFVAVPKAADAG
ncbi:hypothetical protein ACFXJ8_05555 [Nonomuraea sp. NPDC059194]|uniref:hypothetical protein n=1 Tax=Nonomuraea sp. NPDC059194 TaxID=3346764 RepID=UPI00368D0F77